MGNIHIRTRQPVEGMEYNCTILNQNRTIDLCRFISTLIHEIGTESIRTYSQSSLATFLPGHLFNGPLQFWQINTSDIDRDSIVLADGGDFADLVGVGGYEGQG